MQNNKIKLEYSPEKYYEKIYVHILINAFIEKLLLFFWVSFNIKPDIGVFGKY